MSMDKPTYYTYKTAPESPALRGLGISTRQLQRAVHLGRLTYIKPGTQVLFSDDHLRDWIERSTVLAVR